MVDRKFDVDNYTVDLKCRGCRSKVETFVHQWCLPQVQMNNVLIFDITVHNCMLVVILCVARNLPSPKRLGCPCNPIERNPDAILPF